MTRAASLAEVRTLPEMLPVALAPAELPVEPWTEAALTWLGGALDRVALRGMRLAFASVLHPSPEESAAARSSAEPYIGVDAQRFFARDVSPIATIRELGRRAIAGGEAVTRELAAPYEPFHRSGTWPSCVENDRVVIEHWMHRDRPPRATLLALHGFTMGTAWIDAHVLMASQWFARGFDVALVALPFHGPRCPSSARFSGEIFATWDVGRTNEAVRQAVFDADLVRRWIAAESGRPVGVLGLSLGGYVASLMASLYADLAFVIPLVPPVTLDALATSLRALDGTASAPEPNLPLSLAEVRAGYAVHCPLNHALAVPRERVLIVGARGDRLVPPEHAYALWRHWGEPAVHWYSGSHVAPFRRARLVERVAAHLDSLALD
jgi:pimeloyl-ACP methyl ester carboxylesterase